MVEARRPVLLHNALGMGGGLDQACGFVCNGGRSIFCRLNLVTCRAPAAAWANHRGAWQPASVAVQARRPWKWQTCARGTTPIFCVLVGGIVWELHEVCTPAATPTHGARGQCSAS